MSAITRFSIRCLALACGAVLICVLAWTIRAHFVAQPPATAEPSDPSVAAEPLEWDFGFVPREVAVVSHTFTFTNDTSSAVQLDLQASGCNCLRVDFPQTVEAHSSGPVKVQ